MELAKERLHEIAYMALLEKFRENGVMLSPKTVKRDVHNLSKKLGITPAETKECAKIVYKAIYEETLKELETIN